MSAHSDPADRPGAEVNARAKADELIPTRWSLIERLKRWDDSASWQECFEVYWRLVYAVARKAGLTDLEGQEVVQETVISVAKQMPEFKADPAHGSFKGWLLQLTRRRIVDQFRKRGPAGRLAEALPDESARTPLIERVADPAGPELDRVWDEEWRHTLLDAALARVKQRVNPRHYQVFHYLVIKEMTPEQVAAQLGLKIDNVYLAKHRVSAVVQEELACLEAGEHQNAKRGLAGAPEVRA